MTELTADKFLGDGARKLAKPENEDLRNQLAVFVAMWGIDAYTPPERVEERVREIFQAMLAAARMEAQD